MYQESILQVGWFKQLDSASSQPVVARGSIVVTWRRLTTTLTLCDIEADARKGNADLVANRRVIDAMRKQAEEESNKVARELNDKVGI